MPERADGPPFISARDALVALLIEWYQDDEGIADEMSWRQIERQNDRRQQLLAVGIDPDALVEGWPCTAAVVRGIADDMRAQGIHVGIGSSPRCVTCGEPWPCEGSTDAR